MIEVIGNTEQPAMDVLTEKQMATLDDMVSTMNRHMFVSKINYDNGHIYIGVHHNEGTDQAFDDKEYLDINCGAESVGCMLWEVADKVVKHL